MQRISALDPVSAPPKARELLDAVKAQLGGVPAIFRTLAQAPAALGGFLAFSGALAGGTLSPALREQIALAVAGANSCDYCASAHTALGKRAGVAADELTLNLSGEASDTKVRAALAFVRKIVSARGQIADTDLAAVRAAGFSDEAVVEMVAHVAINIFTNYFNHIAATEIDFPLVATGHLKAA